ncbi:hypothetical protein O3G_MSEX014593 [Manduca sexta]|uniref:Uncharacterized protein n=1 Tax=Manduca sexta TaxID=7130 RepID=A0A921ZV97_MANSE|nr:hypothetical protein O3G_MSEX014593 [Manduca sexta]
MFEADSGKAEYLSAGILNWLEVRSIPHKNFIGFASDTTNSMVGEHNCVFSHLKEKVPDITCIKCSCHLIHLGASNTCLKLPRSVEDMLRNIAAHFCRSSKRQLKLQEFQNYFVVYCHKILSPSNTRWPSLKACVDRILEQHDTFKEYFRMEVFEDPNKTTENILETLNSKVVADNEPASAS